MVLVDTSVWVDYFRNGNDRLVTILENSEVFCHDFIVGELACGNLKNRFEILSSLQSLPKTQSASHAEILQFIENHNLMGRGLGYIDISLLASSVLSNIPLWTLDKRLRETANRLDNGYPQN